MALEVVILAAGRGTRMRSELPKALHPLAGRPLLQWVLDTALTLRPARCHVVVGPGADRVRAALGRPGVNWVLQKQRLGTGHALLQALPELAQDSLVLVLMADTPLLGEATLRALLAQPPPALLTAVLAEPGSLGRIMRDGDGRFSAVVEYRDADETRRRIREVNSGVLVAGAAHLRRWLPRVRGDNGQREHYLPDILPLAIADGCEVATVAAVDEMEVLGVNDRADMHRVEREVQRRRAGELLAQGVELADAARIDVRGELSVGRDVYIDINAVFEGEVALGDGARIGPNCVLKDVRLGRGVLVRAFSHLEGVTVADRCEVGPYARLRPGTELSEGAKIGNFVEIKQATIGAGSKVNHLSYVGDSELGEAVNVGAGAITCNFDGADKHRTTLGAGAFIGSNATLVAPVEVSEGGYVAAGSTITRRVEKWALAIARGRQRNIRGWRARAGLEGGQKGPGAADK